MVIAVLCGVTVHILYRNRTGRFVVNHLSPWFTTEN